MIKSFTSECRRGFNDFVIGFNFCLENTPVWGAGLDSNRAKNASNDSGDEFQHLSNGAPIYFHKVKSSFSLKYNFLGGYPL